MPSRQSTVPNLDLGSLKAETNNGKLSSPITPGAQSSDLPSPLTPKSASSSPLFKGATIRPVTQDSSKVNSPTIPTSPGSVAAEPPTPGLTAIPQQFPSPKDSSKHSRDASKSFFRHAKGPQDVSSPTEIRWFRSFDRASQESWKFSGSQIADATQTIRVEPRSANYGQHTSEKTTQQSGHKKAGTDPEQAASKKNKPRFGNLLGRSRSIRVDESSGNRAAGRRPSTGLAKLEEFSQKDTTTARVLQHRGGDGHSLRKERSHGGSMVASGSLSQVSGASAAIFNNLKQSSSGAADRLGKAGKGFFGKITRSGSTNERELINDDNYVCSVINLPLIQQARKTRICKKLEACRDKTEFWMPALPYRSIDYLNFKGCEEEGLYRVPGSGREVKHWQRRFDTELDIDLFDVPDLYDINTIGSLFKAWLRELPDELFPKATQDMIAEKCEGATTAPQLLKDELSKLPPYNYYLLFAITCHLNLLHSYVDQNKMDYRNLCICFQPCMKIDAFCFQFLVCDWKNCWQGCWTEKEYVQKEKEMDEAEQKVAAEKNTPNRSRPDLPQSSSSHERAVSSSSSSQAEEERPRPKTRGESRPKTRGEAQPKTRGEVQPETRSESRPDTLGEPRTRKAKPKNIETAHTRSISQLPELGPPLSPIKI
ncbi:hypothetical protein N7509_007597 [Penicillium cosmopolitanum]|uniref:Rho-GAP domain-containing protein n=1 Tax=Penicillium cosmopolitanum TaxID=1131564 RepID=A0A9X0B8J2_9EURO|nr:uncharacterized protein N7509_007597 [Penicillium cosmopolitanum]KAJ5392107.1 hypothetical protein N7509_007597 [Penicillium cosmopolitanum]